MADSDLAPPSGPVKKRETWSLKTLVQEISGRPIDEFQDPARPPHPYLQVKKGPPAPRTPPAPPLVVTIDPAAVEVDPVDRVFPPLSGATARSLHGPAHEHHAETLEEFDHVHEEPSPGRRVHPPGPSRRPERIYLHYLLLHLDRLSDPSLSYLRHAVDEELRHRTAPVASVAPSALAAELPPPVPE